MAMYIAANCENFKVSGQRTSDIAIMQLISLSQSVLLQGLFSHKFILEKIQTSEQISTRSTMDEIFGEAQ